MKIAIIGGTGFVGSHILDEAAARGHEVLVLVRNPQRMADVAGAEAREVDVHDTEALANAVQGCDVVVHAFAPPASGTAEERLAAQTKGTQSIIRAVRQAGVPRLAAVDGAGTSEVAPGVALAGSYFSPPQVDGGTKAAAVITELLRREADFDWFSLSPPHFLEKGRRTGNYRTGKDNLIVNMESGRSHLSAADYAVALLDEIEQPRHHKERFTVGT